MNVSTPSEAHPSPMVERLSTMQWNRFHTVIVLLFGMGWAMDAELCWNLGDAVIRRRSVLACR